MLYMSTPTLAFWIIYSLFSLLCAGDLASPSTIFPLFFVSCIYIFVTFLLLFPFVSISFVILT